MRCAAASFAALFLAACGGERAATPEPPLPRPSILLVTLDTTRADAIGAGTPAFNALAARGRRFTAAYATAPQTLPSHASMLTGLYPAGHGVHENARFLGAQHSLAAERLRTAGYRTAAFVSAFPLARRFGLDRGFEVYDDELGGRPERSAAETTDRALAWLALPATGPRFLWVHYFEPHHPYEPPPPFRERFPSNPYIGEIAAMDQQLARIVEAFERASTGPVAILVAGDHGEALGEHGEAQHGKLLYEGVMRVPLAIAGPGVPAGADDRPVSVRRVFHTILDWAGLGSDLTLRGHSSEVVLGEAMEPFLQYGWQPQVMTVEGRQKVIQAGGLEVYDLVADPAERHDLAPGAPLSRPVREALRTYPLPSLSAPPAPESLTEEERRRLASLGYVSSEARPVVRTDAPKPAAMAHLFDEIDRASALFVAEEYGAVVPLLQRILAEDPGNLSTLLRLGVAHSMLGDAEAALRAFRRAEALAPDSDDVRQVLALHYERTGAVDRAAPMLERVLAASPSRLPALEGLARIRERQGRLSEALELRKRIASLREPGAAELLGLGALAMAAGDTATAIASYERARALTGPEFRNDLELGVLYLAARRLPEARDALERVPRSHPGWPMALFKRAQVSVLLNEPDRDARIAAARAHADATTRTLIENERLFH